jgi:hypothetical protein
VTLTNMSRFTLHLAQCQMMAIETASIVLFDTGATGSIITWEPALTEIETGSPTVYTGLHGDLTVTKAGRRYWNRSFR